MRAGLSLESRELKENNLFNFMSSFLLRASKRSNSMNLVKVLSKVWLIAGEKTCQSCKQISINCGLDNQ